ncbi:MAG: DNA gyrase inhibitor YacG [Deltaproteobacteria bacterium]|nr:DNA gyrase inhibitor YacG [Deltaproteobacteria bacterium]
MRKRRCAYCKEPMPSINASAKLTSSFCSDRCHTKDLGKWFNEEYTVPMVADELTTALMEGAEIIDPYEQ